LYDFFIKNASDNKESSYKGRLMIILLPDGYVDTLKETYTTAQVDAYLNGVC
jgi:hypothetical protein